MAYRENRRKSGDEAREPARLQRKDGASAEQQVTSLHSAIGNAAFTQLVARERKGLDQDDWDFGSKGSKGGGSSDEQRTLREGMAGADVAYVQIILNEYGYRVYGSGKFDSGTVLAVHDFQRDHGLDANGIVGPETWDALSGRLHSKYDKKAGMGDKGAGMGEKLRMVDDTKFSMGAGLGDKLRSTGDKYAELDEKGAQLDDKGGDAYDKGFDTGDKYAELDEKGAQLDDKGGGAYDKGFDMDDKGAGRDVIESQQGTKMELDDGSGSKGDKFEDVMAAPRGTMKSRHVKNLEFDDSSG